MTTFLLHCNNDRIWNLNELIEFLNRNQQQHIVLKINPEAICLHNLGLYNLLDSFNFESVTIETFNPFEKHSQYKIKNLNATKFLIKQPNIPNELHQWTQNKVFYTCYGRPTAARLGLAAHLYKHHKNISHLHFSAEPTVDNLPLFELDKLLNWSVESAADAASMIPNMPLTIAPTDCYNQFEYNYQDLLTQEYQHCLIDVVSETHVLGNTFFVTEKTTRPMWLKKPFIISGSRDYLLYLRQMGFRTFGEFWDEDYDGFEGPDRFNRIKILLDSLAEKSIIELDTMYQSMQSILEHNYTLLKTQSYNRNVKEIT